MDTMDLAWAVEQACRNAWPAPRQAVIGAWLVRAAGGPGRRINSVNPLRAETYDPAAVIDAAAPLYAALGQPLLFRVPAIAHGLDAALARRGFEAAQETRTLFNPLDAIEAVAGDAVEWTGHPSAAWLDLHLSCNGGHSAAEPVVRAVIDSMLLQRVFVGLRSPGGLAAIAMGALDGGLLVLEAVATTPSARGRGHARQLVLALMAWAKARGATGACLQVMAENHAARRLYERLGFRTDLYPYVYRSPAVG